MARQPHNRRILLPTDFSPSSRAAYPEAVAQAKASGATLVLLNVVDVLPLLPVVAEGPPADEILRQVKKQGCGLVVMGSHGRRGFARWALGSVAERVVRGADCPVMVVKPKR